MVMSLCVPTGPRGKRPFDVQFPPPFRALLTLCYYFRDLEVRTFTLSPSFPTKGLEKGGGQPSPTILMLLILGWSQSRRSTGSSRFPLVALKPRTNMNSKSFPTSENEAPGGDFSRKDEGGGEVSGIPRQGF